MNGRLRAHLLLLALLASPLVAGCIRTRAERGLEPRWSDLAEDEFVRGETKRAQVLERLGVPSQILTVGGGTALYYLQERLASDGMLLLVYNERTEEMRYDRAVFFFDENETLTDYAVTAAER